MQVAVHNFETLDSTDFDVRDYSELKFGSDRAAKKLGYQLADKLYQEHKDLLVSNQCVIIPSAFNVVEIAATIMARHCMNRLNDLLTREGHHMVQWTTMHRTMSYIQDYSYMTAEDRKILLAADKLYINRDFVVDKVLLFVDDVTITGTHEDKIKAFMGASNITNTHMFCYYARYTGNQADIEAQLNLSGVKTVDDYVNLVREPNHHLVVRAVRFLLDAPVETLTQAIKKLDKDFIQKFYYACLAKEYDKIPGYRKGFELVRTEYDLLMGS